MPSSHTQEKGDTNTNPIADMIMKRKCAKVKAAAGMIHMAGFVSSQWWVSLNLMCLAV